jgi:hypothetical protein
MRELLYMAAVGVVAWLAVHFGLPRRRPALATPAPAAPTGEPLVVLVPPVLPATPEPEPASAGRLDTEALIRASLIPPVLPVLDAVLVDVRYPMVELPPAAIEMRRPAGPVRPPAEQCKALIARGIDDPSLGNTVAIRPAYLDTTRSGS